MKVLPVAMRIVLLLSFSLFSAINVITSKFINTLKESLELIYRSFIFQLFPVYIQSNQIIIEESEEGKLFTINYINFKPMLANIKDRNYIDKE